MRMPWQTLIAQCLVSIDKVPAAPNLRVGGTAEHKAKIFAHNQAIVLKAICSGATDWKTVVSMTGAAKRTVQRHAAALIERGRIVRIGDEYRVAA